MSSKNPQPPLIKPSSTSRFTSGIQPHTKINLAKQRKNALWFGSISIGASVLFIALILSIGTEASYIFVILLAPIMAFIGACGALFGIRTKSRLAIGLGVAGLGLNILILLINAFLLRS